MMASLKKEARNWKSYLPLLAVVGLALLVRFLLLPYTNYDTDGYSRWYDFIVLNGIGSALGQNFAIYTPPYLYLLSLGTLSRNVIPPIIAIKLIPIFFDLINALLIYKTLRLKYRAGNLPLLASAVFLLAPTVVMNSALWGQVDSVYTCFLLVSLFLLLTDRPLPAMIAFGLALSIKAQAVFLGPFLMLMALKKRIPWFAFGLVPVTYLAAMLPAVLAGRPVWDVLTVYLNQAAELKILSHNAPNWYIFVPQSTYSVAMPVGMLITILAGIVWAYMHRKSVNTHDATLFAALVSLALTPFLLPKMHDRYFYPADVVSILLAFFTPQMWFVPVCYQIISSLVNSIFLFETDRSTMLILATQLNTIVIVYLLWKQFRFSRDVPNGQDPSVATEFPVGS
jgi:Gpi18-like mannosyltransferase